MRKVAQRNVGSHSAMNLGAKLVRYSVERCGEETYRKQGLGDCGYMCNARHFWSQQSTTFPGTGAEIGAENFSRVVIWLLQPPW